MKPSTPLSSPAATDMPRTVYHSRIDWWIWATLAFTITVIVVCGIGMPIWYSLAYGIPLIGLEICMFGVKYAIEGDRLIVYFFFRAHSYPISKIRDVKFTKGILSAPALSTHRLAIRFTDRSILRSSLPLEISPKDREAFARRLVEINPSIQVVPPLPASSPIRPE